LTLGHHFDKQTNKTENYRVSRGGKVAGTIDQKTLKAAANIFDEDFLSSFDKRDEKLSIRDNTTNSGRALLIPKSKLWS
jgi:hypothetical protein